MAFVEEVHFMDEDFLLESEMAKYLYYEVASNLPIIDYHNHLSPEDIATDRQFENLTEALLEGDHDKWRAMRAHGVEEKYITGNATDKEKFTAWAEVVPHTLGDPLYHWTHLELQRYFSINAPLNPDTSGSIWEETKGILTTQEGYSTTNLLRRMQVDVICTSDDPCDDLDYHKQIALQSLPFRVYPTFRTDNVLRISDIDFFKQYLTKLETVSDIEIRDLRSLLDALKKRHDFFHTLGCRSSDHALSYLSFSPSAESEVDTIFGKVIKDGFLSLRDAKKYQAFLLTEMAKWDYEKGWVQQFHPGASRNTGKSLFATTDPYTDLDLTDDRDKAQSQTHFFSYLDKTGKLPKTIIYNPCPTCKEFFTAVIRDLNEDSTRDKMRLGSAWWFTDQPDGMEKQISTLSNIGLISNFVGMLTASSSFFSFPRHEYFRRLLCNIFGSDVQKGLLPHDEKLLGKLVGDICYYNAKNFFEFD